jgi:phosphoribosylanthranilate isomerase
MTKIKVCGIQSKKEVEIINELPIDYVGFLFAPSKRRISIEKAMVLRNMLNDNIKAVGVFVNEEVNTVNKIAKILNLDVIQLHGEEDEVYISRIEKNVWKAYKINKDFKPEQVMKGNKIIGNLFDGKNPGSGEIFNWQLIEKIKKPI